MSDSIISITRRHSFDVDFLPIKNAAKIVVAYAFRFRESSVGKINSVEDYLPDVEFQGVVSTQACETFLKNEESDDLLEAGEKSMVIRPDRYVDYLVSDRETQMAILEGKRTEFICANPFDYAKKETLSSSHIIRIGA